MVVKTVTWVTNAQTVSVRKEMKKSFSSTEFFQNIHLKREHFSIVYFSRLNVKFITNRISLVCAFAKIITF